MRRQVTSCWNSGVAPAKATFPASLRGVGPIRITAVKTRIATPPQRPDRPYVFVFVETDAGLTGLGEATLEGKPRSVVGAIEDLKGYLLGREATQVEHLWQSMYRHSYYRGGAVITSAIGGIDIALWDILGKALNQPIYKLLGGPVRHAVRAYGHVLGDSPQELAENAQRVVGMGFRALKTRLVFPQDMLEGPDLIRREVARLAALRQAVGDGVDIILDCHGRPTPAVARRLARALEPLGLLFLEEPCPPENVDALARIARASPIPIAAGERLFTVYGFREHLERHIIDVAQPDIIHAGGISSVRKIGAMAEAYYVALAPHNAQGPVATAACLQLAGALSNYFIQEIPHTTFAELWRMRRMIFEEPIEAVQDGYLSLPEKPGLGIEAINEEIFERFPFQGTALMPDQFRADGAVTEW